MASHTLRYEYGSNYVLTPSATQKVRTWFGNRRKRDEASTDDDGSTNSSNHTDRATERTGDEEVGEDHNANEKEGSSEARASVISEEIPYIGK